MMNAIEAWEAIPAARRSELARYLIHGIRPGNTLWLLLSDSPFEAARSADNLTIEAFGPIARFCAFYAPLPAFGSGLALSSWAGLRQETRAARVQETAREAFNEMLADSGLAVDA